MTSFRSIFILLYLAMNAGWSQPSYAVEFLFDSCRSNFCGFALRAIDVQIAQLTQELTPEQWSKLKYQVEYSQRAQNNFDVAQRSSFSDADDRNVRGLQLLHAKHIFANAVAELTGQSAAIRDKLTQDENMFFRLINAAQVKKNIGTERAQVNTALRKCKDTPLLNEHLTSSMSELITILSKKLEIVEVLEWQKTLGGFENFTELATVQADLVRVSGDIKGRLMDVARRDEQLARKFIDENFDLVRGAFTIGANDAESFDHTGTPIFSKSSLAEAVVRNSNPKEPEIDFAEIVDPSRRQSLHEKFLTPADQKRLDSAAAGFEKWVADPANFASSGSVVRMKGAPQEFDDVFRELSDFANNPKEFFKSLLEYERDVTSISNKYGLSSADSARVVLLAWERAEGFAGLRRLDSFVSGADWTKMVSGRVMFRDFFFSKGDTHGRDTHRIQMNLMARYMRRNPEKFAVNGRVVSMSDVYATSREPGYARAFTTEKPYRDDLYIFQLLWDIGFHNNATAPSYLVRLRNLFGLSFWE